MLIPCNFVVSSRSILWNTGVPISEKKTTFSLSDSLEFSRSLFCPHLPRFYKMSLCLFHHKVKVQTSATSMKSIETGGYSHRIPSAFSRNLRNYCKLYENVYYPSIENRQPQISSKGINGELCGCRFPKSCSLEFTLNLQCFLGFLSRLAYISRRVMHEPYLTQHWGLLFKSVQM